MTQKNTSGNMSVPMIVLAVLVFLGIVLYAKNMYQPVANQESIVTVKDLDEAETELNLQDVDGIGNEMPQTEIDAASF